MKTTLAYTRLGSGAPLVLLHGLGSSSAAWDPVTPALAVHFDVIAIDLPGFGRSACLPNGVEPTPSALAAAVATLLEELDVSRPHLVGNSLGGWVALELAQLLDGASITLVCPAGLWRNRTPLYNRVSLRLTRWLAEHATGLVCRLVSTRVGRILVLGQTHGRPLQVTAAQARAAIQTMGTAPGFRATFAATLNRHYVAGDPIDAPITLAFGARDHLLLRRSRYLGELPDGTRPRWLPKCGHVPMTDDPATVAALIFEGARAGAWAPSPVLSPVSLQGR